MKGKTARFLAEERLRLFDDRWVGAHGVGRFAKELRSRLSGFASIGIGGRPASPVDPFRLALRLSRGISFFFSPGFNAPVVPVCPYALCIHDLNHIQAPGPHHALKILYYSSMLRPAIRAAAVVFSVSEYSAQSVTEWARLSPDRVINISNGISEAFSEHGSRPSTGWPYVLYVGNHKPHKNVDGLLRAFASAGLEADWRLVLSGAADDALSVEIERLRLRPRVVFTGPVNDEELAGWYRGARALILVSKYEGFGFPIVEAMACGTPVITSNTASMPEVAGGAALLVNPFDDESIADAIVRIVGDDSLHAQLRQGGIVRATEFSWLKTAERVQMALAARGL